MADRNRDRDRGGRGGGGGGKQSPSTICTYCGARYMIPDGCKHKDDRATHGDGAPVRFRECMACHGQAPNNGVCLNCQQNPGKGGKQPSCPACNNPLPASEIKCRCGWESGMWQCKDCHLWWKSDQVECLKCLKAAEKEHKRACTFVTCPACRRPYKAENKWCDHCNVKCDQCQKWYPKDLTKCPFCDKPVTYDLKVLVDEDETNRRHELLVTFLKTVGTKPPQGVAATVRVLDPAVPTPPGGEPIEPGGTVVHAPYREDDRKVRIVLVNCADGNVGTFTTEAVLTGRRTKFRWPSYPRDPAR